MTFRRSVVTALSLCLQVGTVALCAAAHATDLLDHFWQKSEVRRTSPGNVLRMDFDLTGDGRPEILLSNSQNSGTSGVHEWWVYAWVAPGEYRSLGTLPFSYQLFQVTTQGRLGAYHQIQGPIGKYVTFRLSETGFEIESTELDVSSSEKAADFAAWRGRVALKVLSAALDRLNGTAPPPWVNLLTNEPVGTALSLEGLAVIEN
jgi:hypothetical protein